MRPNTSDLIKNDLVVYHASNHDFVKPDIIQIQKNITNHINGMLGLFFSTTNTPWFHLFGKNIYQIDVPSDFNYEIITVKEYRKISVPPPELEDELLVEHFNNVRQDFINKGVDLILINESDDTCGMGIFINLDVECKKIN